MNPLIASMHFVIRTLPFRIAQPLIAFIIKNSGGILIKTSNIKRNIADVFPHLSKAEIDALTKEMLANTGRHIAETAHMKSFKEGKHGLRIDYTTPDGMVFDGKGPAIYVGAHVGSWEMFPILMAEKNQPFTIIYTPHENAVLNGLMMKPRLETGVKYVEKSKALRPCLKALKNGESIGLLVDQRVSPGVEAEFFGRPASFTQMPARLAIAHNCPIITFDVVRLKTGHLRAVFRPPILPNGEKGPEAEARLTQEIATSIQGSITRNAESWFCSKLRWKRSDKKRPFDPAEVKDTSGQPV
ncbi:MAG: lysophospholipid acyltransferase family protein [Sulfitobacter sp.]